MDQKQTNQTEELVLAEHIDLDRSSFDGNPRLRPAGIPVRLTPSQMEEYVKCSEDPIYFIENYIKIINLDEGLIPFKPWPYQKRMIKQFTADRFSIVKAPRQCGKCQKLNTLVKIKYKGNQYELTGKQLYEWIQYKKWFKENMPMV